MVKAQEWLDREYSKENRSEVKEIYLNKPSLEGGLDLGDFTYYGSVRVYIFLSVDETKLTFKNKPKYTTIILENRDAQRYVNFYHPKGQREQITKLDISYKKLEGNLDLSDFVNLKKLNCCDNKFTSLNVSNCSSLTELKCRNNLLTDIVLPTNPTNLKVLILADNNFLEQDLSFLVPYTSLEEFYLENNKFTGSLDYLSGMEQLRKLHIGNTDLNEVDLSKLPKSLEKIEHSTYYRPNCKLTEIIPQLERFNKYG